MTIRDRNTPARAQVRVGPIRLQKARYAALALVAALALALAASRPADAATQPNIPGYNQAQIDRAISAVTRTITALNKTLHPRNKHRRRHP